MASNEEFDVDDNGANAQEDNDMETSQSIEELEIGLTKDNPESDDEDSDSDDPGEEDVDVVEDIDGNGQNMETNGNANDPNDEYDYAEDIGNEYVDNQKDISKELIDTYHHESKVHNYEEVAAMSYLKRDDHGVISDEFHRTIPILSKFEKARVIGMRMKQLNAGADTFVEVSPDMMDTRLIAEMELFQKKLPFIIRRPLPNGASEYWRVADLIVS